MKRKSLTQKERNLLPVLNTLVSQRAIDPQADVTNAGYMMGDVLEVGDIYDDPEGDLESDDIDDIDDVDDIDDIDDIDAGDMDFIDPLGLHKSLSGDVETGGLFRRRRKRTASRPKRRFFNFFRRNRSGSVSGRQLPQARLEMKLPFIAIRGGIINSSPIAMGTQFLANDLKVMLDRMAVDLPYQQDTGIGTVDGVNMKVVQTGEGSDKFYVPLVIKIGINALNGIPSTPIKVWGDFPTIAGLLQITEANPIVFTMARGYEVDIQIFPWRLVANIACPVLGKFNDVSKAAVYVKGIPTNGVAAVTLITPGTIHQTIVALRKSLTKGR